jgi:hypothetical protein
MLYARSPEMRRKRETVGAGPDDDNRRFLHVSFSKKAGPFFIQTIWKEKCFDWMLLFYKWKVP